LRSFSVIENSIYVGSGGRMSGGRRNELKELNDAEGEFKMKADWG
jgi:hypothetical protein